MFAVKMPKSGSPRIRQILLQQHHSIKSVSEQKRPETKGSTKSSAWEDRLNELADYLQSTGTAMFLKHSENTKLNKWVARKGIEYSLQKKEGITYDHPSDQRIRKPGFQVHIRPPRTV
jgi:thymidylate synthase